MIVVTTPFDAESVDELIREVEVERPFTIEVIVFPDEERSFPLTNDPVVVATTPFTVDVSVKVLVEVEMVRVFEVEDATKDARLVEVATPFMVVVSTDPDVEISFEVMTEVVAVTPFMIVVKTLPDTPCVKELMMFASEEEIPLITVWKKLLDDEATLVLMMVVVPTEPPMFEVRVLAEEERVLEVESDAMVVVAKVLVPVTTKLPVVVAFVVVRLEIKEFRAVRRDEKNPVDEVLLVIFAFVA